MWMPLVSWATALHTTANISCVCGDKKALIVTHAQMVEMVFNQKQKVRNEVHKKKMKEKNK